MKFIWHLLLLTGLYFSTLSAALSQAKININEPTRLEAAKNAPDSAKASVAKPKSLTFTASTDQRFFFFNDTRNDNGRRIPVSVYGIRAGFLFPVKHPENVKPGGMRAAFKTGAGFYFVNQTLDRPGLLPGTSEAIERHLRIVTVYFEPYLFRKNAIEVSLPLELGYGHSRYVQANSQSTESEVARGIFIPAGVGISGSYQFPRVRWFKPIHWFGINLLTGYRFILKKDIPESQINYSGFYISVGPSFFLENLTYDIGQWRKNRKKKKQAR
ncbi:hypothetical protein [Fibrella forsythiae]|uniref:Outer membrane protein beta-barrel domain-containing protein n=1 Tax=Fibrella forsythiae TaxID=2817061 RepID=A0ABS3JL34_9BACT|nr:hypothetical protein [Fibrella forsythiae]MBO0950726.1 hypothetical protein [Fibrella forsythiae]